MSQQQQQSQQPTKQTPTLNVTPQAPVQQLQHREIEIQTTPPKNQDEDLDKFEYKAYLKPRDDSVVQKTETPPSSARDHQKAQVTLQQVVQKPAPKPPCQECLANRPEVKLKAQQKEGQKLKLQNDKLIAQLREMSVVLDTTLEKFKMKKTEKASVQESSHEVNQKQLENVRQQIEFYNKQLANYGNIDDEYSSTRVNSWYSQLREVEDQLEEAKIINRNLQYLNRESERVMASNKKEVKLKLLRDEVVLLKNLIRDARKTAKENESGFKKTQDHLKKLEMRHEEVCKQFGVPFKPFEALPKEEKASLTIKETSGENQQQVVYKITEDQLLKMKQDVKVFEESLKSIRKQMKIESKNATTRLRELDEEKTSLSSTLAKKEKEINETYERLNGFRSLVQSGSASVGLKGNFESSSNALRSGSLHMITPYMKKYKETRRELKGHLALGGAKNFDDAQQHLPDTKDQTIQGVSFWFVEDMIMGMETTYQLAGAQQQQSRIASIDAGTKRDIMKSAGISLLGSEYFVSIEGYQNFHCIEFLKFTTSRGNVLEVGSKKNLARCKKFAYEIRKNEIPVSFFGHTDLCFGRKDDKIKDYGKPEVREKFKDTPVLVNFGVEIRKKDVYQEPIKAAASLSRTAIESSEQISVQSHPSALQEKASQQRQQQVAVEPTPQTKAINGGQIAGDGKSNIKVADQSGSKQVATGNVEQQQQQQGEKISQNGAGASNIPKAAVEQNATVQHKQQPEIANNTQQQQQKAQQKADETQQQKNGNSQQHIVAQNN